jgi:hypothetical protein
MTLRYSIKCQMFGRSQLKQKRDSSVSIGSGLDGGGMPIKF